MPPVPPVNCVVPSVSVCSPTSARIRAPLPLPDTPPLVPAVMITVGEPVMVCVPLFVTTSARFCAPLVPPVIVSVLPPAVKLIVCASPSPRIRP